MSATEHNEKTASPLEAYSPEAERSIPDSYQPGVERSDVANEKNDQVIEEDDHWVHQKMDGSLFMALLAMSFLWVGSQIPLYLFGSILPAIYSHIGGADRYVWMVIGYLIPCACLCPFVGALSDIFGRKNVGCFGQVLLIIGSVVTSTAHTINIAIAGQVISGFGAGLNELIALAGTSEMVPVAKRGIYIGGIVATILPFCPSALWAQLITAASSWRWVGMLVGAWNFVGLALLLIFYKDRPRSANSRPRKTVLREIDYLGGILSCSGVTLFMMGMQWGATQYSWHSLHVLVPFIIGIVLIIAFMVWETSFAPYPMVPAKLFSRSKRTMILTLLITFFSGANFFALLLFWPTEVFNVYGFEPVVVGVRTLPVGFGIIGGAMVGVVLISALKGRIAYLMIFSCALMTAGTGALAVARTNNLGIALGVLTIASIGVGLVIIPCSIICQICCPFELIGTITAITLSIRYIGGAIGFTAYYNIFEHKFVTAAGAISGPKAAHSVATAIVENGISLNPKAITELITLAATAQFDNLKLLLSAGPAAGIDIQQADVAHAYSVIVNSTQYVMAEAYQWPYFISIAFGGVCLLCSLGLKDIRGLMDK